MGRLMEALLAITHPARTLYGPGPSGGSWFDAAGREMAGVGLFVQLNAAVGTQGLA